MMYDKAQCKILFQIIRVSLFDSDEFEINAEADWKLIYRISREHKIHTILCRGLEKIMFYYSISPAARQVKAPQRM